MDTAIHQYQKGEAVWLKGTGTYYAGCEYQAHIVDMPTSGEKAGTVKVVPSPPIRMKRPLPAREHQLVVSRAPSRAVRFTIRTPDADITFVCRCSMLMGASSASSARSYSNSWCPDHFVNLISHLVSVGVSAPCTCTSLICARFWAPGAHRSARCLGFWCLLVPLLVPVAAVCHTVSPTVAPHLGMKDYEWSDDQYAPAKQLDSELDDLRPAHSPLKQGLGVRSGAGQRESRSTWVNTERNHPKSSHLCFAGTR
jgi:hypothetical protein